MSSQLMQEQEKLLTDAVNNVKCQSFQMQRCLDKAKVMDGLKHANNMLTELRTSALSPRSYYELYMIICDELTVLECFLVEEFRDGRKVPDLYELVQYAANILPRLYLLITVGLVYIKTNEFSRRDILIDLVEMCRGVQHPLRGLFLRNYLLQCSKKVLPDCLPPMIPPSDDQQLSVTQPPPHSADGTIDDSIDFILVNFAEMNKLWVRIQHQGHSRDRDRRERERMELRILVGTNLVRLSQLDHLTVHRYDQIVLPGILEQVLSCRDGIAQEYVMECIVQVFPDELHLATLPIVLTAITRLEPTVNVKKVIVALIDRLAAYYANTDSHSDSSADQQQQHKAAGKLPTNAQLFEIFSREIASMLEKRADTLDAADMVSLQVSLANLACQCSSALSASPGDGGTINGVNCRTTYLNNVFGVTLAMLTRLGVTSIDHMSPVDRELMRLIRIALTDATTDEATLVDTLFYRLPCFISLVGNTTLLSIETRAMISTCLLTRLFDVGVGDILGGAGGDLSSSSNNNVPSITESGVDLRYQAVAASQPHRIASVETLDKLLTVVVPPLVVDEVATLRADRVVLIAGLVHHVVVAHHRVDDVATMVGREEEDRMLRCMHRHFAAHAKSPAVLSRLYTPLVMAALRLATRIVAEHPVKTQVEAEKRDDFTLNLIRFAHDACLTPLASVGGSEASELVLRLYLQIVLTLDRIHRIMQKDCQSRHDAGAKERETMAYEFMSQAFAIYEEEMSDRRSQLTALHLITGTLKAVCCSNTANKSHNCRSVLGDGGGSSGSDESRQALLSQCRQSAATRVVRRADQCRGLLLTAHLAITPRPRSTHAAAEDDITTIGADVVIKEEKRVSDQLAKALKLASNSIDAATRVQLYIEVLDHYVHFYERFRSAPAGVSHLSLTSIEDMVVKIKAELAKLAVGGSAGSVADGVNQGQNNANTDATPSASPPSAEMEHARKHFSNTLRHIRVRAGERSGAAAGASVAADGVSADFSRLLVATQHQQLNG